MVALIYGSWIPPKMVNKGHTYGSMMKMEDDWIFAKNTISVSYRSTQDFDKVENWEMAINDPIHNWVLHHRDEDQMKVSSSWLKSIGQYFNLPPEKLIWMRSDKHRSLHRSYNCWDLQQ